MNDARSPAGAGVGGGGATATGGGGGGGVWRRNDEVGSGRLGTTIACFGGGRVTAFGGAVGGVIEATVSLGAGDGGGATSLERGVSCTCTGALASPCSGSSARIFMCGINTNSAVT